MTGDRCDVTQALPGAFVAEREVLGGQALCMPGGSLAAEWAGAGIRVNAVAPGYVKTDMAPVDRPEFRRYWIEDTPQQRYALPEEIAPAIVFLASAASSFITGSVLVVDGGYTLW